MTGWQRVRYATQTILYHELALLAAAPRSSSLTWNGANQVGLWTFAVLWVHAAERQAQSLSRRARHQRRAAAGCRAVPEDVLSRKPISAFCFRFRSRSRLPLLVVMIQRIVEVRGYAIRRRWADVGLHAARARRRRALVHDAAACRRSRCGAGACARVSRRRTPPWNRNATPKSPSSAQSRRARESAPRCGASETDASGVRPAAA